MKIFLIGFMGSGKTTLGKKLANKLGYAFLDLDEKFEEQQGCTITAYFAQHSEEKFRELESNLLKTYSYPDHCVVATGGGAPCHFDNMDWMNAHGTTVYLEMSPETLAQRLERGRSKRPLLRDLDQKGVISFITDKLHQRSAYYGQAKVIIKGTNLTADIVADRLTRL